MTSSLLPSLLAFVAVILTIPGALWLVKRAQGVRSAGDGALSVVAGVPVGPRERVSVVRAGSRYLVLGVAAQSVTLLAELDEWPRGSVSSGPVPPLAAFLRRSRRDEIPKP